MKLEQIKENGFTAKMITRRMIGLERFIYFYNKKYDFDLSKGTSQERKSFKLATKQWDRYKAYRDILKMELCP